MKNLLLVTMVGLSLTGFSTFKNAEAADMRLVTGQNRPAEIDNNRAGFALAKQGRYAEAEPYFQRELQTAPNSPYALLALGGIYEVSGRFSQARVMYQRILALRTTESNAGQFDFNNRGSVDAGVESFNTIAERHLQGINFPGQNGIAALGDSAAVASAR